MASASKKTGDERVGRRIASQRGAMQMSRDDLAREIGASYTLVAQIETGWRMPSYEKQLLIAKALGAGLDELFGDDDLEVDALGGPPVDEAADVAQAMDAFPLGVLSSRRAPSALSAALPAASASDSPSLSSGRPTFEGAIDRAAEALRSLPASRRLDALSRLQLSVVREVADEERRRVGSEAKQMGWITALAPDEVFVFGADAEGHHVAGAARTAYERFGAEWGTGSGPQGQAYGIVTTNGIGMLRDDVDAFLRHATAHPRTRFLVTPIGTGTAGYRADEIGPLFDGAPGNVILPAEFREL